MAKIIAWLKWVMDALGIVLPNTDQVLSWVRSSMTGLGVIFVQHGWVNDSGWLMVTGIVMFITPYVWGWIVHTLNAKVKAVEAILPSGGKIIIPPTASPALIAIADDDNRPKVVSQAHEVKIPPHQAQ